MQQQQSPYVATFLNKFPANQRAQLIDTLLIIGIQSVQSQLLVDGTAGSTSGRQRLTLQDLQRMIQVNAALTFAQNEYLPLAKQAIDQFKEKISQLGEQLTLPVHSAVGTSSTNNQSAFKRPTETADIRLHSSSSTRQLEDGEDCNNNNFNCKNVETKKTEKRNEELEFQLAKVGDKENRSILKQLLNVGESPQPSGGEKRHFLDSQHQIYPHWWGHQEQQTAVRPIPVRAKSNARLASSQLPSNLTAKSVDPWQVPKKTTDEAIQTNDRELEYRRQLEAKELQLKRAARRQQTASPPVLTTHADDETLGGFSKYFYTPQKPQSSSAGRHVGVGVQANNDNIDNQEVSSERNPPQTAPPSRRRMAGDGEANVVADGEKAGFYFIPNEKRRPRKSAATTKKAQFNERLASVVAADNNNNNNDGNLPATAAAADFIGIAEKFVNSNFVKCLDC